MRACEGLGRMSARREPVEAATMVETVGKSQRAVIVERVWECMYILASLSASFKGGNRGGAEGMRMRRTSQTATRSRLPLRSQHRSTTYTTRT